MSTDELYALALSVISSPSAGKLWDMICENQPVEIFEHIAKLSGPVTQNFLRSKYPENPLAAASEIRSECLKKNIKVISYWSDSYPEILKQISKPPLVLYCKGELSPQRSIAIVGTRNSGEKSSVIARRLAVELSGAGFTIVSGMAIGVDREAHMGALNANGSTIGVLANGIDIIYPAFNRDLYAKISESGKSCLISEYPPGILAGKWTFVRRNRIISGLSSGVVIVKAALKSGALITANHAIDQNREVFACPGLSFDKAYAGCNELIRNGAVLVSCTEDIINELSGAEPERILKEKRKVTRNTQPPKDIATTDFFRENSVINYPEESMEWKILDFLAKGENDIDTIVRSLDTSTNIVNETLVMLELSNEIMRDGNVVSRC